MGLFGTSLSIVVFCSLVSASIAAGSDLPIADVHMHAYEKTADEAEWFGSRFEKNGIRWAGGVGNYSEHMANKLGQGYIAAFGQDYFMGTFKKYGPEGLVDLENPLIKKMFAEAKILFEAQMIKGFGEIHIDNETPGAARKIPLINPVTLKMLEMTEPVDGFVQFHAQFSDTLESDVLELSNRFPRSKIILAHCVPGKNPDVIKLLHRIFNRTQNVYCETSGGNGPTHASYRKHYEKIFGPGNGRMYGVGGLDQWWRKLILRFPDRVMVGTDPCCGRKERYDELVHELRTYFLPELPEDVREKVAYKNALNVFGLSE